MNLSSGEFLEGIRVLDLTSFLAGPYGTQVLADAGADVIKIESPSGDSSRAIPPHFVGGESVYFHTVNRNKRSVVLDLKQSEAVQAFRRLAAGSDVIVENFRPGVMERLGIGLAALRAENPALVTCSISGFGADSPHRDVPAYDAVIQAWSGGMSLTGHPGAPPARMGIPIGDLAAGMFGALGILGALVRRGKTGVGDHVDVAMYDAQIALLGYQVAYYLHSGEVPGPQGAGHLSIPTYRTFLCSDNVYVMVTANTERMWQGLCAAVDAPELVDDPRFVDNAARLEWKAELWPLLEAAFLRIPSKEIIRRLRSSSVPVAPVNDIGSALKDVQVAARRMVVDLVGSGDHHVQVPGNPIKAEGMRDEALFTFPSELGADTRAVLHEVGGLSEAEVIELLESGAAIERRR